MLRMSLLCFVLCWSWFNAYLQATLVANQAKSSVVLVLAWDKGEKTLSLGSGFFVNANGDIVTNYHLVKRAARTEIMTCDGKMFSARTISVNNSRGHPSQGPCQQKTPPLSEYFDSTDISSMKYRNIN